MIYDFAIHDRHERLVAVIEAKARRGVTADWAARFYGNLLEHPGIPAADYFGIVTPEHLYLWRPAIEAASTPLAGPRKPSFVPDLSDHFRERSRGWDGMLEGRAFELLVASWLYDLIEGSVAPQSLVDTGLPEAVKNGRVTTAAAA